MSQYNKEQFLYKKSYLKHRLQKDVMEDGIAYIPCNVKCMEDIISKFSVKGCESLDSEFLSYIIDFTEFIPIDNPVVLEISGSKFSLDEKKIINETIEAEMDYLLGKTENDIRNKNILCLFMGIGTLASGILLAVAKQTTSDVPLEFFFVLFWLFADALVRYLFIERIDLIKEKIRTGRLASMSIEYEENSQ